MGNDEYEMGASIPSPASNFASFSGPRRPADLSAIAAQRLFACTWIACCGGGWLGRRDYPHGHTCVTEIVRCTGCGLQIVLQPIQKEVTLKETYLK